MQFVPAKNKLEAVARISFLTNSGPEVLGPGSKERKSVFINLARGLKINFSESDTKQEIAKKVVVAFGGVWDASCESVGQTVTLIGLNRILKLAEQKLESANQNLAHDIENIPFDEETQRDSLKWIFARGNSTGRSASQFFNHYCLENNITLKK